MMIQLNFVSGKSPDAFTKFSWCLSPKAVAMLKEKGVLHPCVLLSVTHNGEEVDRKVVPLGQRLEYIQFRRPGLHTIHAVVIHHYYEGNKEPWEIHSELKDELLSTIVKSPVRYRLNLYNHSGNFCASHIMYSTHNVRHLWERPESKTDEEINGEVMKAAENTSDITVIEVAEGFFAKEPPKWLGTYVNFMYRDYPRDQCEFRRRMITAFTIKPPLALFLGVLYAIMFLATFIHHGIYSAGALLFGRRYIGWQRLLKPLSDRFEMDHIKFWKKYRYADEVGYWSKENAFFVTDKAGNPRPRLWLLFRPMTIFSLLSTFAVGIVWGPEVLKTMWEQLANVNWIGLLGLVMFSAFLMYGVSFFVKRMQETPDAKRERWLEKREKRRLKEDFQEREYREVARREIESLSCELVKPITSIKDLPPDKVTVYLRFMDFKNKVCRPFALR